MPYLTPNEIPESDTCRSLSIPSSSEWLAFFGGALTELAKTYNWQQFGSVTVEETVAKMQSILDNWYELPCAACTTPGGYRVIRINSSGQLEQLDENGDWEPATDEYDIPAPEAREGGTSDEQICLAAANAVNVLHELYESLSDSFGEELTEAQALTAFIAALIALVGFAFAPITWAIAAFFFVVFELLYQGLFYLTADLWTEDFSKQIVCFLVACASNDAGVVTFDWECFNEQLNSLANDFSLSELQLRLYLQVGFILQFIGGADGLNLAGGTTEISVADCSECENGTCYEQVFTAGSEPMNAHRFVGDWNVGGRFEGVCTGSNYVQLNMNLKLGTGACDYDKISFEIGLDEEGGDWEVYGMLQPDLVTSTLDFIDSGTLAAGLHTIECLPGGATYYGIRYIMTQGVPCDTETNYLLAVRLCSPNLGAAELTSNCEDCP